MQRGHAYDVVALVGAQTTQHVLQIGERTARDIGQLATGGRQRDAARMTLEQRQTEPRFQLAHVMADGARRDVELLAAWAKF